jgi:hypothetical protein
VSERNEYQIKKLRQEVPISTFQDKIPIPEQNYTECLDTMNPDRLPKQILADRDEREMWADRKTEWS